MKPQPLQEMEDPAFLAKVDVLMEHLERQVDGNSLGEGTVSAMKSEIRRRILMVREEKQIQLTRPSFNVDVRLLSLDSLISYPHTHEFDGLPFLITITGCDISKNGEVLDRTIKQGYFSQDEAEAYLDGVKNIANDFGINICNDVPQIDDLEEEIFKYPDE